MNIDTDTYNKLKKYPDRIKNKNDSYYGLYYGYGSSVKWASAWRTSFRSILIHTTNGNAKSTFDGEASYLLNSKSVSANFIVGQNHQIAQIVDPRVIAWHSGDCYDNDYENPTSIGIEIHWTPSLGVMPDSMIYDVSDLVKYLVSRYPMITKIDTHRKQAKPLGRKIDPSGWDDNRFYEWRSSILLKKQLYTVKEVSNIRDNPNNKTAKIVGKANPGDTFTIYDEVEGSLVEDSNIWARVGDSRWIWRGLLKEL